MIALRVPGREMGRQGGCLTRLRRAMRAPGCRFGGVCFGWGDLKSELVQLRLLSIWCCCIGCMRAPKARPDQVSPLLS